MSKLAKVDLVLKDATATFVAITKPWEPGIEHNADGTNIKYKLNVLVDESNEALIKKAYNLLQKQLATLDNKTISQKAIDKKFSDFLKIVQREGDSFVDESYMPCSKAAYMGLGKKYLKDNNLEHFREIPDDVKKERFIKLNIKNKYGQDASEEEIKKFALKGNKYHLMLQLVAGPAWAQPSVDIKMVVLTEVETEHTVRYESSDSSEVLEKAKELNLFENAPSLESMLEEEVEEDEDEDEDEF